MALQIVARIDRERRVIDRRAVGNHHQNAALLAPSHQTFMRPVKRLAVDVLLEQALAHHQAKILARAPPGGIGRLVDDVAQVVEAARIGRLAGCKPSLARLSALPGTRRESQDLDLDTTPLGRPRIEPELSRSSVTTVSRNLVSFSRLNESGWSGSTMMRESRAGSSRPSSRSNSQARFCCAIRRRCSRLASRATTPCKCESCLSR